MEAVRVERLDHLGLIASVIKDLGLVTEILKFLPENPEPIIMDQIVDQITRLGSIYSSGLVLNSS